MSAQILRGKIAASHIKAQVAQGIKQRLQKGFKAPGLAVILVGDHPASKAYIHHKQKASEQVGILSKLYPLESRARLSKITALIDQLNEDPEIHGILLQLPLPNPTMAESLLEHIHPKKDVDGFHPYNMGRLVLRKPLLRPCTPWGIIQLLKHAAIDLAKKHAVIVGCSNIVGRPMALELLLKKCTITVCHRYTKNLAHKIQQADILVTAIGHPGVIQTEWIKEGSIVIDVGFTHLPNGKISGDIDFDSAKQKASFITPVPGGVGLMTVAMLLSNTLLAANKQDHFES